MKQARLDKKVGKVTSKRQFTPAPYPPMKWNCKVFGHTWVCDGTSNAGSEWQCGFCGRKL